MAKKSENKEKTRLLRLPNKLDKDIQARAKRNQRSINGQIIFDLEHSKQPFEQAFEMLS